MKIRERALLDQVARMCSSCLKDTIFYERKNLKFDEVCSLVGLFWDMSTVKYTHFRVQTRLCYCRDRKVVCYKVLHQPPSVLGRTHSHRCVSFCRSEVVISRQAILPSVHLPKKTNKTLPRLHKLTKRYECLRPKTQGRPDARKDGRDALFVYL